MTRSDKWMVRPQHFAAVLAISVWGVLRLGMIEPAFAQKGFAGCLPVAQRTGEVGCWIVASESIGQLPPSPMFWHLDKFSTRASAEASQASRGTVVQALGKVWLLTIAEEGWRPSGGEHVAEIGPLPINAGTKYVAQYMEAIMNPGMETRLHRHPGPEAWYTEGGETCLETPLGKQVGRKGFDVIVPGGQPMKLSVTGTEQRRSLVLVLHDASQPWMTMASDWTAKGLCGR
jgi:quercetin dioxygenase-like cupin family protein